MLISEIDEASQERENKLFKKFQREGNQRTHVMESAFVGNNRRLSNFEEGKNREIMPPIRWTGGGIAFIVVGKCWLTRLSIGGWNLVEALKLYASTFPSKKYDHYYVNVSNVEEIEALALGVNPGGRSPEHQELVLCACGNDAHLRSILSKNEWRRPTDQIFEKLKKMQPSSPPPPPPVNYETVVSEGVEATRLKATKQRADNAWCEKCNVVLNKLQELGFDWEEVDANLVKEFWAQQRDHNRHAGDRDPFPRNLHDRIEWLYKYRDDDFYGSALYERRLAKKKK